MKGTIVIPWQYMIRVLHEFQQYFRKTQKRRYHTDLLLSQGFFQHLKLFRIELH